MFSCARVRDNLIIQVNFRKALIGLVSAVLLVSLMLWLGWIIVVKIEAKRLREEIQQSMSGAITAAIQQSFDKNHANLLNLEACQARLKQTDAISSDLAKMVNKKILSGEEESEAPPKPQKPRSKRM